MPTRFFRAAGFALALAAAAASGFAQEQEAQATSHAVEVPALAPGFSVRPKGSKLVVLPADLELFSISAGGIEEPRADWTESAQKYVRAALAQRGEQLGAQVPELSEAQLDELAEPLSLHKAVAFSIYRHHGGGGLKLPTKDGKLDWSMGADAVKPLKAKTGADYALFVWVRDSYASNERKAAIFAMALLGSINTGGQQIAYASLVDLNDGRVVWYRELDRMWGDLREPQAAAETIDALFQGFPPLK